jgi:hypothetical protein
MLSAVASADVNERTRLDRVFAGLLPHAMAIVYELTLFL